MGIRIWLFLLLGFSFANAAEPPELPVDPENALETIHVRDGYTIELVAAEPLVKDPVAIAWGADGKLWVAEMADYPLGMDGKGKSGGRVRFLEDTDGDGKFNTSTVFIDNLNFPSGVLPWKKGILITAAPEIIYAEDLDGDGKADKREVLLTGFDEANQQLRVNGLRRGLENWIHCASGSPSVGRGKSQITSSLTGKTIQLGSLDFRFRPETGEFETMSGPTQFGRNRDAWGNWFGCMNSYPLWHFVLEDSWLKRNPFLKPPDPRRQLILPRNPRVYPAKEPQKRFHSYGHIGHYTSSCGGMIYRDTALFPGNTEQTHAFACEPFHNLVQHFVIEEDGVSFQGKRDDSDGPVDFFASTDRWCRPVQVRTGPDGALWVVDMYRYIIEHAQFLPETGKKELGEFLRVGDDRGRIYRIFPSNKPTEAIPNLSEFSQEQLVGVFEKSNGPLRDLAQEKLVSAKPLEEATIELLKQSVDGKGNEFSCLHALWTLQGIGELSANEVVIALKNEHPQIRRNAIRLALKCKGGGVDLVSELVKMTDDPNAQVRLQLAATLGELSSSEDAVRALGKLAVENAGDIHFDATVLSSAGEGNIESLVNAALSVDSEREKSGDIAGQLLAMSVALGRDEATLSGLKQVLEREDGIWKFGTVAGLLDSLQQHDSSIEKLASDRSEVIEAITEMTKRADEIVQKAEGSIELQSAALRLLARSESESKREADIDRLGALLVASTPASLQSAIIRHLATLSDPPVGRVLLAGWKNHSPAARTEILGVIPTRREWVSFLLDDLESGAIPAGHINPGVELNMRRGTNAEGRERLKKIFVSTEAGTKERKHVVTAWKPALDLEGDKARGVEVFKMLCASCHEFDGVGNDIGPDLASLSDRRPIALFTAILDPNAQLDSRYSTYVATTKDDRILVGFLAAESGNSITLKGADNQKHDILRDELKSLESTGLSLMPEGLEVALDHQKLADLIAYLSRAKLKK